MADTIAAAGLGGIENRLSARALGRAKAARAVRLWPSAAIPTCCSSTNSTVGLDVESRRTLWAHIRGYVKRGGSVLLTTHYLEEADDLAHPVAVIDRGRIAAEGTPAQIKAQTNTSGLEDAFLAIMNESSDASQEVLR